MWIIKWSEYLPIWRSPLLPYSIVYSIHGLLCCLTWLLPRWGACQDSFPHITGHKQQHTIMANTCLKSEKKLQWAWKIRRYCFWPVWWDTGTPAAPEDWHISGCWSTTEEASSCWVRTVKQEYHLECIINKCLNCQITVIPLIIGNTQDSVHVKGFQGQIYCTHQGHIDFRWLTPEVFQLVRRTAPCCPWGRSLSWGHPETRLHGEVFKTFRKKSSRLIRWQ